MLLRIFFKKIIILYFLLIFNAQGNVGDLEQVDHLDQITNSKNINEMYKEMVGILSLDKDLKFKLGKIDRVNEAFLLQNYRQIKEKLSSYSHYFKLNQSFYLLKDKVYLDVYKRDNLIPMQITQSNIDFQREQEKIKNKKIIETLEEMLPKYKQQFVFNKEYWKNIENIILLSNSVIKTQNKIHFNKRIFYNYSFNKMLVNKKQKELIYEFILQYLEELKQNNYSNVPNIINELYSKYEENVDPEIQMDEITAYTCSSCIRFHNAINLYKINNEKINHKVIPIAIRKNKEQYVIIDAMVYLALKETMDKNEFEKINEKLILDSTLTSLNINSPVEVFKWLRKESISEEKFKNYFYSQANINKAKEIANILEQLKLKTVPMLIIDNKFLILKNVVNVSEEYYDEDITLALIDYVVTLATLEKYGLFYFSSDNY